MERIKTLRGKNVALTGFGSRPRRELRRLIRRKGGRVSGAWGRITSDTDILVRGEPHAGWKHGTFGRKEARAADLIRNGSSLCVILSSDLEKLLMGKPVTEFSPVGGFDVSVLRTQTEAAKLDQPRIISQRLEQGKLREIHVGRKKIGTCSICGRRVPTGLLVVGHIKQRNRCSVLEKRDLHNIAMSICLLGCDSLYERGFIAVSPEARIVVAKDFSGCLELGRYLSRLSGRKCLSHSSANERYFAWHRQNVFMGPGKS